MKEHHRTDRLTLITIILVIVTGIILITYKAPRLSYQLTQEALLEKMQDTGYVVDMQEAASLFGNENVLFVDLRNSDDYFVKHIEGAINIPTIKILDEENVNLFKDSEKTYILYGEEHIDANGPYMLLTKLGFDNIRVLLGGYSNFLQQGNAYPEYYANFAELIRSEQNLQLAIEVRAKSIMEADEALLDAAATPGSDKTTSASTAKKPAAKVFVPPPPPAEEEEEGC